MYVDSVLGSGILVTPAIAASIAGPASLLGSHSYVPFRPLVAPGCPVFVH
jgi:hypothetical protein